MTTRQARNLSKTVRSHVGMNGKPYPIVDVDGFSPPKVEGYGYYHTTLSGKTVVRYPNAYGYRTLYHPSTKRIVVGRGWLIENGLV